jgi:hypothetical protein
MVSGFCHSTSLRETRLYPVARTGIAHSIIFYTPTVRYYNNVATCVLDAHYVMQVARVRMFQIEIGNTPNNLTPRDIRRLAKRTEGRNIIPSVFKYSVHAVSQLTH